MKIVIIVEKMNNSHLLDNMYFFNAIITIFVPDELT